MEKVMSKTTVTFVDISDIWKMARMTLDNALIVDYTSQTSP
jgi:hypothetical protein